MGIARPYQSALEQFETEYGVAACEIPAQAYVRAMHGCDKFCSYCVVPYVRGPETSRPPEAIIEQTKRLAQNGIKQITLLGQRINAYEYKAGDKTYCLADLLEMISEIDGIEWLKFVTSYPSQKYFKEIMLAIANLPKVCRYLHIPAQSGSDQILKAMNRGYTSAEYLELLDTARQIVPDIAIAGDFIVGFPGETDDDFSQTVDLVKKAQYKNSFIFKYSPRPGTIADKRLEDNVPQEIKERRNHELLKVQEEISRESCRPVYRPNRQSPRRRTKQKIASGRQPASAYRQDRRRLDCRFQRPGNLGRPIRKRQNHQNNPAYLVRRACLIQRFCFCHKIL